MYNFFADETNISENGYIIEGSDFNHIANVLRMKPGENFYVSCNGRTDLCRVTEITDSAVYAGIIEENALKSELSVEIHLFQGLPKGDTFENEIMKAVELGITKITPVAMKRSVVKLDEKKQANKLKRWNAIAESAAKQSKRNLIPEVKPVMSFSQVAEIMKDYDLFIVPYENQRGVIETKEVLSLIKTGMKIGIIIGPEGGFEDREIQLALENGGRIVSLGRRILRVETAAVTAMSMCMLRVEELEAENEDPSC